MKFDIIPNVTFGVSSINLRRKMKNLKRKICSALCCLLVLSNANKVECADCNHFDFKSVCRFSEEVPSFFSYAFRDYVFGLPMTLFSVFLAGCCSLGCYKRCSECAGKQNECENCKRKKCFGYSLSFCKRCNECVGKRKECENCERKKLLGLAISGVLGPISFLNFCNVFYPEIQENECEKKVEQGKTSLFQKLCQTVRCCLGVLSDRLTEMGLFGGSVVCLFKEFVNGSALICNCVPGGDIGAKDSEFVKEVNEFKPSIDFGEKFCLCTEILRICNKFYPEDSEKSSDLNACNMFYPEDEESSKSDDKSGKEQKETRSGGVGNNLKLKDKEKSTSKDESSS